jgi:hypothetical protein
MALFAHRTSRTQNHPNVLCFSTSIRPAKASPSQGQELVVPNAFTLTRPFRYWVLRSPICDNGNVNAFMLSASIESRIDLLFAPEDRQAARRILIEQCGPNLSLTQRWNEEGFERIQCAALRLSNGDVSVLLKVVDHATCDWRDVLVAAGFAHDVLAHKAWLPDAHEPSLPRRQ